MKRGETIQRFFYQPVIKLFVFVFVFVLLTTPPQEVVLFYASDKTMGPLNLQKYASSKAITIPFSSKKIPETNEFPRGQAIKGDFIPAPRYRSLKIGLSTTDKIIDPKFI